MMTQWCSGNELALLECGAEFFPALIAAVDASEREIFIETYILRVDKTTLPLLLALMAASQRGVRVCVLADGFGSKDFPLEWREHLRRAGVCLRFFRPERWRNMLHPHRLRRLHRKLAVIDARTAFVGGINLHDDFDNAQDGDLARYDYAVRVRGAVVCDIHANMLMVWRHESVMQRVLTRGASLSCERQDAGAVEARFIERNNVRYRRGIEREYLQAMAAAQQEIVLACAYFLPGWRFRRALRRAARRGVRVRLLLQGKIDHPIAYYASRVLYRRFLCDGIEIYEYTGGYLHAKVAVIDRFWATVGSSNLDPFSFLLAKEANILLKDQSLAEKLQHSIVSRIQAHAQPVEWSGVQKWRWYERAVMWGCYEFVRVSMGVLGLGWGYLQS